MTKSIPLVFSQCHKSFGDQIVKYGKEKNTEKTKQIKTKTNKDDKDKV